MKIIEQPSAPTLGDLLSRRNVQFRVPIYQRDYAWHADQLDDFVNDVFPFSSRSEEHFFGTIVLAADDPGPTYDGHDEVDYVIDGQQRLITSLITISVLRHHLYEISMRGHEIARDIANDLLSYTSLGWRTERRPKLHANRLNQRFLDNLLDGFTSTGTEVASAFGGLSDEEKIGSATMFSAYKQIRLKLAHRIAEHFQTHLEDSDSNLAAALEGELLEDCTGFIESFVRSFLAGSSFIEIRLRRWEDAFTVFEGLNNRGLDLTEKDLIKNMILSRAHRDDGLSNFELIQLEERWAQLTRRISDSKFSNFLRHYLFLTHPRVELKRVVRVLNEHVETKSAREIVDELDAASKAYYRITTPSQIRNSPRLKTAFVQFRTLEAKRVFPIPLAAILTRVAANDQIRLLDAVETMFFRRSSVMHMDGKDLERDIQVVAADLYARGASAIEEVIAAVVAHTPSDDKFESTLVGNEGMKESIARYMLIRMENFLRQDSTLSVDMDNVTLEHILPKQPSRWELSESESLVHSSSCVRIGNLTLLKDSSNSALGNSPFDDKRDFYGREGLLINTNVVLDGVDIECDVVGRPTWDSAAIGARQGALAKLAVKVWSLPR